MDRLQRGLRYVPPALQRARATVARFAPNAAQVQQAQPQAQGAPVDERGVELWPLPLDVEEQLMPDAEEDAPDVSPQSRPAPMQAVSLADEIVSIDAATARSKAFSQAQAKHDAAAQAVQEYEALLNDARFPLSDAARLVVSRKCKRATIERDALASQYLF